MLTAIAVRARRHIEHPIWTNVYGLARTLLALGIAGTLAFTEADDLFATIAGGQPGPSCSGIGRAGLFCLVPPHALDIARWIAVAMLLGIATGIRPRLTALPHWWLSFSVFSAVTVGEGSDQVAAVLTLLLLPVALTDPRPTHWHAANRHAVSDRRRYVAFIALQLLKVQVAVIYFHAATAKFGVEEWADGTALYYWLSDPMFAAPSALIPLLRNAWVVTLMTWGSLALELSIALSLLLRPSYRRVLLPAGIAFHAIIAVLMGLPSFFLEMAGALVILLHPWDRPFVIASRRIRGRTSEDEASTVRSLERELAAV